jgi:hypothetical protein
MQLEDQVISLEYAKQFKELRIEQSSLFFYTYGGIVSRLEALPILESNYSAFTVAELGEMLPKYTHSARGDDENHIWECIYDCGKNYFCKSGADNEADARAKMLIYLIENKLMEIPK